MVVPLSYLACTVSGLVALDDEEAPPWLSGEVFIAFHCGRIDTHSTTINVLS